MKKKTFKLQQYPLNGAKVNSAQIARMSKQYFVIGDNQNNIKLYMNNEQQLMVFNSNNNNTVQTEVSAVSFNITQQEIFSGSNRGIINIWDITTGKSTCILKGHSTSVNCFGIFSEDQPNRLASGSYDTYIKLWDTRSKNNTGTLKHHTKQINSLDISPDGRLLISGSQDATAKLWDIRYPQRILTTYTQHTAPILKVRFNPQDCMFASCSMDRTSKYFRCEPNHYNYISSTDVVATPITAIDFNQNGKILATASNDLLKLWNMGKNGLLIQQIQSSWKNVQDICWIKGGLMGLATGGGNVSLWVANLDNKTKVNKQDEVKQQKGYALKFYKPKIFERQNIDDVFKDVNKVRDIVNNLENIKVQKKNDSQFNSKRQKSLERQKLDSVEKQQNKSSQRQLEKKKTYEEKKAQQTQKKMRQKIERKIKQQQQKKLIIEQKKRKQEQIRKKEEQQLKIMEQKRISRERILQNRLKQTFQYNNNQPLQSTLEVDNLEYSHLGISAFMGDGVQKQKHLQMQLIGQILKDSSKFDSVMTMRSKNVQPIIHYWKQGKIKQALFTINQSELLIVSDCISMIVTNPRFKSSITPEVATQLLKKLGQLMLNKHSTYVKTSMTHINTLALMYKEQLIKVKSFNPMTRVDLSREERLAKYDALIQELLNIFRQDRLKRYATKKTDNQQLSQIASQLYKNLQQILRKIMPKKQPEAV